MIELPTERSVVENYNPKLLIIYGLPKCGKSSFIASIDNNLVIDLEDGYRALSVIKVQARSSEQLREIRNAIIEKGKELNQMPYKYITIDNATRLEEIALPLAAELYRATPMGVNWGLKTDKNGMPLRDKSGNVIPDPKADVRKLPNGSGYLFQREALKNLIHMFQPLCETLILVCHVKEKQIRVRSEDISQMCVDLAGKLADIICGEADGIGLMVREDNKTFLSFVGGDNTIKEARCPHLRGKKFLVGESDENNNVTFSASEIFI